MFALAVAAPRKHFVYSFTVRNVTSKNFTCPCIQHRRTQKNKFATEGESDPHYGSKVSGATKKTPNKPTNIHTRTNTRAETD